MKLKSILIVSLLVLFPVSLFCQSSTTISIADDLTEQIEQLENLQKDLIQQAELLKNQTEQLKTAEQNLTESQNHLMEMQIQFQELSKDLKKSETQLQIWKIISITSIAITAGTSTALIINLINQH